MNQELEAPPCVEQVIASPRPRPPVWLVLAAFASVYIIWGSTYLGIHIAIQTIPPLLMAGARIIIAGVLLYAVMRIRGAPRPDAGHWLNSALIGGL